MKNKTDKKLNNKPVNKLYFIITVFVIAFIANSLSLKNDFVADDVYVIKENENLRNWNNVCKIFTKEYFEISKETGYRPLATFSYFVMYKLFKLNPAGYHFVSVLIHSLNAVLVFSVGFLIFKSIGIAFIAALLFALHPVHAEAVLSISFNEDLFAGFLLLIGFLLHVKNDMSKGKNPAYYRIISRISYLMALFFKESSVVFIAILLIYDFLLRDMKEEGGINKGRKIALILKNYIDYIVITGFYILVRFVLLKSPFNIHMATFFTGPFSQRILTITTVFANYLRLSFLPINLCTPYDLYPVAKSIIELRVVVSILLLIIIGIIAFLIRKRSKYIFFFISWFFISLLPVSNIISIGAWLAERYLYFPIIGFCFILAILINKIRIKPFSISIASVILILYFIGTVKNNLIWRNEMSLWTTMKNRSSVNVYARRKLASAYLKEGNIEKAIEQNEDVIRIYPGFYDAHNDLGTLYKDLKQYDKAIMYYKNAIAISNKYAQAHNNLGILYKELKNYDKAIEEFQAALKVDPNYIDTYNNLGVLYIELKDYNRAIQAFNKTIELNPNYIEAHNNLANIWCEQKEYSKAIREFQNVLKINPDYARGYYNLGVLYCDLKDYTKAIQQFKKVLTINPNLPEVHNNLGFLYYYRKEYKKALREFEYLLRLDPYNKNAKTKIKMLKELIE